jgi:hypothetical protein
MSANPLRVFISHASEDKERFVTEFARKLRSNGIDAWLDKWEMLPGDSLVDKIFEEGLKNAQAVVVVLSAISVTKPWVREEINAAFVKRISNATKLIPVVIDECEVPQCLQSTLWQRIDDLQGYDAELQRIVLAILGRTDKPPLGPIPKYAAASVLQIYGLTQLDTLVFAECCQIVVGRDHRAIAREEFLAIAKSFEIPEQEFEDSLQLLEDHGYIKIHGVIGCKIVRIEVSFSGLERYLESTRPDFGSLVDRVAAKIVNEQMHDGAALFAGFGEPIMVFGAIVHILESRGLVRISWYLGGPLSFQIRDVSAQLRRALQ